MVPVLEWVGKVKGGRVPGCWVGGALVMSGRVNRYFPGVTMGLYVGEGRWGAKQVFTVYNSGYIVIVNKKLRNRHCYRELSLYVEWLKTNYSGVRKHR